MTGHRLAFALMLTLFVVSFSAKADASGQGQAAEAALIAQKIREALAGETFIVDEKCDARGCTITLQEK